MQVTALDHLVLTVRDLAATCEFYTRVLGMRVTTFAAGRTAFSYLQERIAELRSQDLKPGAGRPDQPASSS